VWEKGSGSFIRGQLAASVDSGQFLLTI